LGFKTVAFGDKLREFLYTLNPVVDGYGYGIKIDDVVRLRDVIDEYGWNGYKETQYSDEIRRLMQVLGTDCGRGLLGDSIWIDATLGQADHQNLVVADCRFPNEAQAIVDRGGIIIRIEKDGLGPVNDHPSETAMDGYNWDWIIWNDWSIDSLHQQIRDIVDISSRPG
jgi:hypothetical protein